MPQKWDLIVLGGGPAGYVGAARAARAGLATLLIEQNALGGVCLNEGCIPSKTLLYSAKLADGVRQGAKYGVVGQAQIDHAAVIKRKDKVVRTLTAGIRAQMKAAGVTVLMATGEIAGRDAQGLIQVRTGEEIHLAQNLLVATGSAPVLPPIAGLTDALASGFALTSREALCLTSVPGRLVVVGGGVIGMELASYYLSAGSQVTVVEMLPRIGGALDAEIADNLMKNYTKQGMAFRLNARVTALQDQTVHIETQQGSEVLPADQVLVAVGRRPRTQGLGLDSIGLELVRGTIPVDEQGRTPVAGVYAAGDVNGKSMLAHTASREAEIAVDAILGRPGRMDYDGIPAVIYTQPEVAGVGLTLEQAQQREIPAACQTLSLRYSGRYLAENEGGDGLAKLIYHTQTQRVLGAHLIGSYASEIIGMMSAHIAAGATLEQMQAAVLPHPTVGEIFREAAAMVEL